MIYILVFMASVFFAWLAERSKNKSIIILCSVISILIPSILGGLRHYTVGVDSAGYGITISNMAMSSSSFLDFYNVNRIEPGCIILFYCGVKFCGTYSGAFFLFEFITMACFYIGAYKHRKFVPLSLVMFVFFCILYLRTYNEIRQSIAASIIFMGLNYLESKEYIKFSLYIAVAMMFHYSAGITIFMFLGFHLITTAEVYKKSIYLRLLLLLGTIVFLLFAFPIMNVVITYLGVMDKYSVYLNSDQITLGYNVSRRALIVLYFGELLMFIFYNKGAVRFFNSLNGEQNSYFYEFSIIFCLSYLTWIAFFDRILFYTDFANILVVSSLPFFVKEKNLRFLVFFTVLIIVLIFWYYKFLFKNTFMVWPYRSILD